MTTGVIPATGLQASSMTLDGGSDAVLSPCMAEALVLYSTSTFTFTYADASASANPLGATVTAQELSSTCYTFKVISGRFAPFTQGQVIGYAVGSGTLIIRPDRSPA